MAKVRKNKICASRTQSLIGALGFLVANHFDMKVKVVGGNTLYCFKRQFGFQTKMNLDGFLYSICQALSCSDEFKYEIRKITGKKRVLINVVIIEGD